jgi:hypothetical protein
VVFEKTKEGIHPELEERLVELFSSFSPFEETHVVVSLRLLEGVKLVGELVVFLVGE